MKPIVCDANVALRILLELDQEHIIKLREKRVSILDLTLYEVGNALWKVSTLLKSITTDTAIGYLDAFHSLIGSKAINVISFANISASKVMDLAYKTKLTFYDCSYIVAADDAGAVLVTEDEKLGTRAREYTQVTGFNEFVQLLKS